METTILVVVGIALASPVIALTSTLGVILMVRASVKLFQKWLHAS